MSEIQSLSSTTPFRRLLWSGLRRARGLLGVGPAARQSLAALGLNSTTSLVAGAVLGSITGTFEALPGLLVLVPAAIGLRGNIFSTVGNRLSTAMHTGELDLDLRRRGALRQNVEASLVLTLAMSVVLALLAWFIALAIGVDDLTSPLVLVGISVAGGVLADGLGLIGAAVALYVFVRAVRSRADVLRRVVQQSWPILTAAALLSTLAGIALESRLEEWRLLPALLVLQPAFVSSAGALGGIFSSRAATKLHLGQISPTSWPGSEARADAALALGLAVPVYLLNGLGAHLVAHLIGERSPGLAEMVAISLLGGVVAVLIAVGVAYYGTIASTSAGVDPDTYGIPVVTSSVDFAGVVVLIAAVAALSII